jgi:ribosome-binding protein aMBF1 (putative translation factor)
MSWIEVKPMAKLEPKPNRILRKNTPQREAELTKLRRSLDQEQASLKAEGKAKLTQARARRAELAKVFSCLKAEREKQGLSLADMSERCGMAREVISRLESLQSPNPTIATIQRYATALGLEVTLSLTPTS